ncbi:MAG: hypothetical protein CML23_10485 [Rhizobiaceae bacterium]|nr:hypothetical protein [Rhizobiaceae bacterium]
MEWQMPLKHLEGRLSDAAQRANPIGPMAETSLFWAEIYRPTLSYLRDGGNNVLVLSHEDMFEDVERTYQSIAKFLDLSDTDHRALNFARESTSASTATAEGKTLHQMSRDSRTLARSFRQKTSPEELKTSELMLDGIYDELRAFAAAHAL